MKNELQTESLRQLLVAQKVQLIEKINLERGGAKSRSEAAVAELAAVSAASSTTESAIPSLGLAQATPLQPPQQTQISADSSSVAANAAAPVAAALHSARGDDSSARGDDSSPRGDDSSAWQTSAPLHGAGAGGGGDGRGVITSHGLNFGEGTSADFEAIKLTLPLIHI